MYCALQYAKEIDWSIMHVQGILDMKCMGCFVNTALATGPPALVLSPQTGRGSPGPIICYTVFLTGGAKTLLHGKQMLYR